LKKRKNGFGEHTPDEQGRFFPVVIPKRRRTESKNNATAKAFDLGVVALP
jgi:hypothetical protein